MRWTLLEFFFPNLVTMRTTLLEFFSPNLVRALRGLRRIINHPANYINDNTPMTTNEAIELIGKAMEVVSDLRKANREAAAAVQPLINENRALQQAVDTLTAADAAVDTALEGLRDKLAAEEPAEPVATEPVAEPEADPVVEPEAPAEAPAEDTPAANPEKAE